MPGPAGLAGAAAGTGFGIGGHGRRRRGRHGGRGRGALGGLRGRHRRGHGWRAAPCARSSGSCGMTIRRLMPPCDSGTMMLRSTSSGGASSNIWTVCAAGRHGQPASPARAAQANRASAGSGQAGHGGFSFVCVRRTLGGSREGRCEPRHTGRPRRGRPEEKIAAGRKNPLPVGCFTEPGAADAARMPLSKPTTGPERHRVTQRRTSHHAQQALRRSRHDRPGRRRRPRDGGRRFRHPRRRQHQHRGRPLTARRTSRSRPSGAPRYGHGRSSPMAGTTATSRSAAAAWRRRASPPSAARAYGRGRVITSGGDNLNIARAATARPASPSPRSAAPRFGRGTSFTSGGYNTNLAAGKFSDAEQQVLTMGGTAAGHGTHAGVRRRQPQRRARQGLVRRPAGGHRREAVRPACRPGPAQAGPGPRRPQHRSASCSERRPCSWRSACSPRHRLRPWRRSGAGCRCATARRAC